MNRKKDLRHSSTGFQSVDDKKKLYDITKNRNRKIRKRRILFCSILGVVAAAAAAVLLLRNGAEIGQFITTKAIHNPLQFISKQSDKRTPTPEPTNMSTPEPTETPTPEPTETPTPEPTETPTPKPTETPTPKPTETPTPEPTETPTPEPTETPTPEPTKTPTPEPTNTPTPEPTNIPDSDPSIISAADTDVQNFIYLSDFSDERTEQGIPPLQYCEEVRDNTGMRYKNGIRGTGSNSYNIYYLQGQYAKLEGKFVLNFSNRGNVAKPRAEIYGDGRLLYESPEITAGILPQEFSLDVSGVQVLRICIDGENYIRLVDCVLSRDPVIQGNYSTAFSIKYSTSPDEIYLADLDRTNASNSFGGLVTYSNISDNQGTVYNCGIGGYYADVSNWNEYELNGRFSGISGWVFLNSEAAENTSEDIYVEIYADDRCIFRSELITAGMAPQYFELDIQDVRSIKVSVDGANLARIGDCILYRSFE